MFIYSNGTEVASTTGFGGSAVNPNANVYLGGDPVHTGNGRGFIGVVDELKFFDTFLDAAAVQQAMIPEPATLTLLGLGGLFVALRRRK